MPLYQKIQKGELSEYLQKMYDIVENNVNIFYQTILSRMGYTLEEKEIKLSREKVILFSFYYGNPAIFREVSISFLYYPEENTIFPGEYRISLYLTIYPTNDSWTDIRVEEYIKDRYKIEDINSMMMTKDKDIILNEKKLEEKVKQMFNFYIYYIKEDKLLEETLEGRNYVEGYDSYKDYF